MHEWEDYNWAQRNRGLAQVSLAEYRYLKEHNLLQQASGQTGGSRSPSTTSTTPGTAGAPSGSTHTDDYWDASEEQEIHERMELRLLQLNQEYRTEGMELLAELPAEEEQRIRDEVVARRSRRGGTGGGGQTGPGTGHTGTGGTTGPGGGRGPGGPGGSGRSGGTAPHVPLVFDGEHANPNAGTSRLAGFGHAVVGGFFGGMTESFLGGFSFNEETQRDIDQQQRWEEYNWQRREQGLPTVTFDEYVALEREHGPGGGASGGGQAGGQSGAQTGRARSGAVSGAAAAATAGSVVAASGAGSSSAGHAGPDLGTPRSGRLSPHSGREQLDPEDFDLEELADRLYDRMRTRMRTELIVDRERAGLLTDFR